MGTSGWKYNGILKTGSIGISPVDPYDGNGSVLMTTTSTTGKAEIELRNNAGFGLLKDLNLFSYSWYRDSATTADAYAGPVARLLISDGKGHAGYLIWEQSFN